MSICISARRAVRPDFGRSAYRLYYRELQKKKLCRRSEDKEFIAVVNHELLELPLTVLRCSIREVVYTRVFKAPAPLIAFTALAQYASYGRIEIGYGRWKF